MNIQIVEDDHNFYVVYDVGAAVGQDLGSFLESSVKKCFLFPFLQSLYSEHQSN